VDLKDLQHHFMMSLLDRCQTSDLNSKQLDIYRNNRRVTLIKTLCNMYSVCEALVGHRFFWQMSREYVNTHPSTSPTLQDYGETFHPFIATFPPAAPLPYLPDVARLEWIIHRTTIGVNATSLEPDSLTKVKPEQYEQLVLPLIDNSTLFYSPYPVDKIWIANQTDSQNDFTIDLFEGECRLFIWRQDHNIRLDRVTTLEWELLTLLSQKLPLHSLLEKEMDKLSVQEGQHPLIQHLPHFIQKGYINNIFNT